MKLKHLLIINGILAIVAGLAFALEWGPMVQVFSNTLLPPIDNTPHIVWVGGSFTRMFGITLFGWGLLILVMLNASEPSIRRKIAIAMLMANTFFSFMALLQQLAIWDSLAGWITVVVSALLALGYAYFFARDLLVELVPPAKPAAEAGDDTTYDLERIRYITQNYSGLQGLRMVPFGLWFLALGAGWLGKPGDCTYSLPSMILVFALIWAIGAYYQRRFGRVKQADVSLGSIRLKHESPLWLLVGLVIGLVILMVANLVLILERQLNPPVSLVGLTMAAFITIVWLLPSFRPRLHYLVIAILLAGISILPLAGVASSTVSTRTFSWTMFYIAFGLFFFIGGLFDHLLLVRAFKSLPQEESYE